MQGMLPQNQREALTSFWKFKLVQCVFLKYLSRHYIIPLDTTTVLSQSILGRYIGGIVPADAVIIHPSDQFVHLFITDSSIFCRFGVFCLQK